MKFWLWTLVIRLQCILELLSFKLNSLYSKDLSYMPMHICHAIDCSKKIPPRLLMCIKHWLMVPYKMQREIWRVYVPGQEIAKNPTPEYMAVQQKIIQFVADKEGKFTPSSSIGGIVTMHMDENGNEFIVRHDGIPRERQYIANNLTKEEYNVEQQ